MNALNVAVQEEIRAAALEATERADVRAVVLYGGPKVFAAGADIKEMVEMSYADMVDRSSGLQGSLTAVTQIPKPVIAAGLDVDLDTGLAIERALFTGLFATEDRITGMRSFIANGPGKAEFGGR